MKPQFRCENGQLYWRDYGSNLAEMRRLRQVFADPENQWVSELTSSAELTQQIDDAIEEFLYPAQTLDHA